MIVDSHCHLNYPQFEDLEGVIARAQEAGVQLMQTILALNAAILPR